MKYLLSSKHSYNHVTEITHRMSLLNPPPYLRVNHFIFPLAHFSLPYAQLNLNWMATGKGGGKKIKNFNIMVGNNITLWKSLTVI